MPQLGRSKPTHVNASTSKPTNQDIAPFHDSPQQVSKLTSWRNHSTTTHFCYQFQLRKAGPSPTLRVFFIQPNEIPRSSALRALRHQASRIILGNHQFTSSALTPSTYYVGGALSCTSGKNTQKSAFLGLVKIFFIFTRPKMPTFTDFCKSRQSRHLGSCKNVHQP